MNMKRFFNIYWQLEKSQDGLWFTIDKSGHKINNLLALQNTEETDISAYILIIGKYSLKMAKFK